MKMSQRKKREQIRSASKSRQKKATSPSKRKKQRKQIKRVQKKTVKNQWALLKQLLFSLNKAETWKKIGMSFSHWIRQKETLVLFLLLCTVVFFFLHFGIHQVDGHSMEPTFKSGERILVDKNQPIGRYNIVTFEPKNSEDNSYVKRIIGLPDDRIQVEGTALFLLPKESEGEGEDDLSTMPDGTIKITVSEETAAELSAYERIPDKFYFVQGDNRLHSDDSRVFGLVHINQIEGIVCYRYYPLSKMGLVH